MSLHSPSLKDILPADAADDASQRSGLRSLGGAWRHKSGVGSVAHGIPNRVGKIRGLGNAIVPQVAAAFVSAYMEIAP